jgi:hypothetical protein
MHFRSLRTLTLALVLCACDPPADETPEGDGGAGEPDAQAAAEAAPTVVPDAAAGTPLDASAPAASDASATAFDAATDASDGWDGAVPSAPRALRINEVDCENERVEVLNTGSAAEDLSGYALTDDMSPGKTRMALSGVLPAGAYQSVDLAGFALKCGEERTFLLSGEALSDVSEPGPVPGGATWGRLPNGTGSFGATNPTLGSGNSAWVDQSAVFFAPHATPVEVAITLDAAATAALTTTPRSYARASVTLRAGGKQVGPMDIGVRLKGSLGSFRTLAGKASFKLDAAEFVKGQSFLGHAKLTLNNLAQDPSTIHEWLGYQMFAAAGVPAPRLGFATVTVNGQAYGTYVLLEDATSTAFARTHFASTTAMYEPPIGADLVPEQVPTFDVKQGSTTDFTALLAIAEPLANGTRSAWYDAVSARVDLPEVLRMLAVDILNGNGDGYAYARNNYYMHLDGKGVLRMVPWGIDSSFGATLNYFRPIKATLLNRCFDEPRCASQWVDAMEAALGAGRGLLSTDFLARARRLGELNVARFAGDTRWDHSASTIAAAVESTLARIAANLDYLEERVACHRDPNTDPDGDGRRCELDCDDSDASRYRGAPEVCWDRVDQSCNGVADDDGECPACVATPKDASLFVCPRAMTVDALRAACAALGATPLTITSGTENARIANALSPWFNEASWFVGLADSPTPDAFVWTSGDTGSYRNFVDGFPFRRNVGEHERCATMGTSGGWRTEQCSSRVPGACER